MSDTSILSPGDLLLIETGEYSDRTTIGPFRVLKILNRTEVSKLYVADFRPDREGSWNKADPDGFLPWLVRHGYVEDVESTLWHVGSYGEFCRSNPG